MRKVLIDTDGGIDDLLALILAAKSSEINLKGVMTVSGAMGEDGHVFVQYLIQVLDSSIPVIQGAKTPLKRELRDAKNVHGSLYRILPRNQLPQPKTTVKEFIDYQLRYDQMDIICLGPLTNIANYLNIGKHHENIRRLYLMGGAVYSNGNFPPEAKPKVAEYNIFSDPEAAEAVFSSGIDIVLVSLDSTKDKIVCNPDDLKGNTSNQLSRLIGKFYHAFAGRSLFDPVTVAVAINEQIANYEQIGLSVDCGREIGRTIMDSKRNNVQLCTTINKDEFFKMFNKYVNHK